MGSGVNNKYYFTEKERDTETNYDYFGARYYDSELARWLQEDPLWEKYHGWSPYNYTLNNPLKYVDPDGRGVWPIKLPEKIVKWIARKVIGSKIKRGFANEMKEGWGKKGEDLNLDGIPDNQSERDRRIYDPEGYQRDKDLYDGLLNSIEKERIKQFQNLMELNEKEQENKPSEDGKVNQNNSSVEDNSNFSPDEFELSPIDFSKTVPPVKLKKDEIEDLK